MVSVAFAWALPSFASYGDVADELKTVELKIAIALAVVAAANLVTPAAVHKASVPGLGLASAVKADWTTSAITNTIPGGSALAVGMTWTMYRSWDIDRRAIARSVVVTGVWDTFVKFGTPLLALVWLSSERPVGAGLVQATVIGCCMFTVVLGLGAALLAGPSTAARIGRLLDRLPFLGDQWPRRLGQLRVDTVGLLRERWRSLTFWTVAGHANFYLLLLLCLRAVGVGADSLTPAAVLAAFAFGRLVTAIPLTPGGLGVMEVGLTGALSAVGDTTEAALIAAVLIFRFCTFFLPIPLGAASWLAWTARRRGPDKRDPDMVPSNDGLSPAA